MSVMRESYEQRRERLSRPRTVVDTGPAFLWADDYLAQKVPPSSEQLLDALAPEDWSPAAFVESARELLREEGLSGRLCQPGDQLPALQSDAPFKYWPQYLEESERADAGEDLVIVTVTEDDRVIGFGVAKREADQSEIEIINVDDFSGRLPDSSGPYPSLTANSPSASDTLSSICSCPHCSVPSMLMRTPRVHATSSSPWDSYRPTIVIPVFWSFSDHALRYASGLSCLGFIFSPDDC